ncbi:hypothetical protein [Rhizorhabdus phycosphaerae]|uniref:hypothetical protein n=1 Tax=Rhizorhabdus phycosphaerae TaxID=2711156 RepID=UPI0013ED9C9A|nr:hypothetical protein [Rhizorhabdus phycosphaerae]
MKEAIAALGRVERLAALATLVIFAAFVIYRIPLGYSHDGDAYGMLGAWQRMHAEGRYVPSRPPGYIVAEFLIGFAASIGGAWLSNTLIAILSIFSLYLTFVLARDLGLDKPLLLPALMAASPYVMIASSSSMDYMISYVFLIGGMVVCLRGGLLWGILFLAIAGGARLTNWTLASAFLIWLSFQRRDEKWWRLVAILTFITGLFYVPIWISSHLTMNWLRAGLPDDQGLIGLVARFFYKIVQPFGFIGTGFASILISMKGRNLWARRNDPVFLLGFTLTGINLIIFARAPIEIYYLIYAIPFLGLMLLRAEAFSAVLVLIFGGLIASFVHLDLISIRYEDTGICGPLLANGARFAPSVREGVLIAEIQDSIRWDQCNNVRPGLMEPYGSHNAPLPIPNIK